jgi:hypothetical protein
MSVFQPFRYPQVLSLQAHIQFGGLRAIEQDVSPGGVLCEQSK